MITVLEPKQSIVKLWGKQKIKETENYRLMRYIYRTDYEEISALYNVVTGQLILVNQDERELLSQKTIQYSSILNDLIENHYLVPLDYEEHIQVINLRKILRKLYNKTNKDITSYTIIPTTACNARCYYCFEAGERTFTMTEKTADDVVNFINKHCGEKREIYITWFGGEPTIATNRIDQICLGLRDKQIKYHSFMYSNGYIFDENMVKKAKQLWSLERIQIVVDAVGENYNRIKSYHDVNNNPYERVFNNIGLFLDNQIQVTVRTNIDINNYNDYPKLLQEIKDKYHANKFLNMYVYPIIGEYAEENGRIYHADDEWMKKTIVQLNDSIRDANLFRKNCNLPSLKFKGCMVDNDESIVIKPTGDLCKCLENFKEDENIGTLIAGINNTLCIESWKEIGYYNNCYDCVLFPECVKMAKCKEKAECYKYDKIRQLQIVAKEKIKMYCCKEVL